MQNESGRNLKATGSPCVVHIITRWDGGSAKNVVNWMELEAAAGRQVSLIAGRDNRSPLPNGATVQVNPFLIRRISPLYDIFAFIWLIAYLLRHRPAIVHTHQAKAGIIGRLASVVTSIPLICHTVHLPSYWGRLSVQLRWLERVLANKTDIMYFVGNEMRISHQADGIQGLHATATVHSPVDLGSHLLTYAPQLDRDRAAGPKGRDLLRHELLLDHECRILLNVGSLEKRKRQADLIKTFASRSSSKSTALVIVGDGPERPELERLATQSEAPVHLLGHRDDIPALMASADAYVHASELEGVPQVALQAAGAGLEVFGMRSAGIEEIPVPVTLYSDLESVVSAALAARYRVGLTPRQRAARLLAWSHDAIGSTIDDALTQENSLLHCRRGTDASASLQDCAR